MSKSANERPPTNRQSEQIHIKVWDMLFKCLECRTQNHHWPKENLKARNEKD